MNKTILFATLLSFSYLSFAQHKHSNYVGEDKRIIKSLSDEDIQNLQEGSGMGLAKAAELNHYPGPKHVLDNADELQLSDEQKFSTEKFFRSMHEEAVRLGNLIIEKEQTLDSLFANSLITQTSLKSELDEIAQLRSQLRFTHLHAHLEMKNILSEKQIAKYDELRGYVSQKKMKNHQTNKTNR
ncbi:MAG: hypothetical protein KGZ58_06140 [Ignavibacteriales bacterium]|nr:hypothetical protein [Ignavibacteriales bacterium]